MSDPFGILPKTVESTKAVSDIIGLFSKLKDIFKPFKPIIRVANFDYIDRTWEAKFLLQIKKGWGRKSKRKVEIPAYDGARVDEVLAGEMFQPLTINFDNIDHKYIFRAGDFPNCENFLVTLTGQVTEKFLRDWVEIRTSKNPTGGSIVDKYWIYTALKNVSILEAIHDEFNVDRVSSDVKVGVERVFTTAIPSWLKKRIVAREELLTAIERGNRRSRVLEVRYRRAARDSRLRPFEISRIVSDLTSGDYFREFIDLDHPFQLANIFPSGFIKEFLPERVNVQVTTRLNLKTPVVEGYLSFEKNRYTDIITEKFKEFLFEKKKPRRKMKPKKKKK